MCEGASNKEDVKGISDELLVHWNGPLLNQCDSVVRQGLNVYFKGGIGILGHMIYQQSYTKCQSLWIGLRQVSLLCLS